jgi:hypothetical protein
MQRLKRGVDLPLAISTRNAAAAYLIRIKALPQTRRHPCQNNHGEMTMSTGETVFLVGFIAAFAIFAIVMGWADHQTRGLGK